MRLFITGGAGFIGSNFVRLTLDLGYEVTVYDSLTYAGNLSSLQDLNSKAEYRFVKGDICDLEQLRSTMREHDAVVHFAAESHVDRSISGPHDFVRTNCTGTNLVMFVAKELSIDRVIHISTDEVYGQIAEGSFKESDPLDPRSPYSASKAGSDLIALSYFSTFNLPVIVTRSSNNFGPYQYPEKVIPLFVTNLMEGHKVPLYGKGMNIRDWCYVEDNCRAIELVLREGIEGEIYNIGAGSEITNRDLTQRILELMNRDESMIELVADRLGHDQRYSVDTSKIEKLGWKPSHDFDSALLSTVDWYKNNRWWWEPLTSVQ